MTTQTLSTTDRAASIRTELKTKYGWTSRDVSVRADYFSMGSALRIVVKNPAVPLATVKGVAAAHESISRCELTGEILAGANRYVSASYSREAADALTESKLATVRAAVAELATASENVLMPVAGTNYMIGRGRAGYGFSIWTEGGHQAESNDERGVALYIAIGSWNQ